MGVREEACLVQEMQYVIENLIYHITEIMVRKGFLALQCLQLIPIY